MHINRNETNIYKKVNIQGGIEIFQSRDIVLVLKSKFEICERIRNVTDSQNIPATCYQNKGWNKPFCIWMRYMQAFKQYAVTTYAKEL